MWEEWQDLNVAKAYSQTYEKFQSNNVHVYRIVISYRALLVMCMFYTSAVSIALVIFIIVFNLICVSVVWILQYKIEQNVTIKILSKRNKVALEHI